MASIKLGPFVSEIRGKLGGSIFSRNANGAYVRSNTQPTNPQTPLQQAVRQAFAAVSSSWKALTSAQRASWTDLAATSEGEYINRVGDVSNYTGQQLFMKRNNLLSVAGQPTLSTPDGSGEAPQELGIISFQTPVFTVLAGNNDIIAMDVETTRDIIANRYMVYASPIFAPGKERPKSLSFKLLNTIGNGGTKGDDEDDPDPLNLLPEYLNAYPGAEAVVGSRVYLKAVLFDPNYGKAGVEIVEQFDFVAGI